MKETESENESESESIPSQSGKDQENRWVDMNMNMNMNIDDPQPPLPDADADAASSSSPRPDVDANANANANGKVPPTPPKDAFPIGFHQRLVNRQACHLHLAQLYRFVDSILQSILIVLAALTSTFVISGTSPGATDADADADADEISVLSSSATADVHVDVVDVDMPLELPLLPPFAAVAVASSSSSSSPTITTVCRFMSVTCAIVQYMSSTLQLRQRVIRHRLAYKECMKLRVQLEEVCGRCTFDASAADINMDMDMDMHDNNNNNERMMRWIENYQDYVRDAPAIPPSLLAVQRRRLNY